MSLHVPGSNCLFYSVFTVTGKTSLLLTVNGMILVMVLVMVLVLVLVLVLMLMLMRKMAVCVDDVG